VLGAGLIIAAAIMVRSLFSRLGDFATLDRTGLILLGLAVSLSLLSTLLVGVLWIVLLRCLGAAPKTSTTMRFFISSWPFRYIPGTLPYHAIRVLMAEALGTSKARVVTSIAYESILMLGGAAALGVSCTLMGAGLASSKSWMCILAALPVVALPLILNPGVLIPAANRLLAMVKRSPLAADSLLTSTQASLVLLGYAGVNCVMGASFWLVLCAMTDASLNPLVAIGAFSLAAAAGVAVVFVPSGIGVREAVIAALLAGVVAPEDALLAAGALRVVSIAADFGGLAITGAAGLAGITLGPVSKPQKSDSLPGETVAR
jgi:uncharacterized membrane protein YbhN (UPF0104 family)